MDPIYLDYNATTPIDPVVAEAMKPFLSDVFGNPSSAHAFGVEAKETVDLARRQVAGAIGARPSEIVFTSGGTEANNHAIRGAALAGRARGGHIVTSAVEHPAVTEVCRYLETRGFRTTEVPVDEYGILDAADIEAAISPETVLITVMHANNEVGSIQPLEQISRMARERGIPFHTDAAQSLGKIPVKVDELGVDLLSIAGHKLYGPKGVGALYVRDGTALENLMYGAAHEGGRRPGTENLVLVAGLGKACELADKHLWSRSAHVQRLRDRLHAGLSARFPDLRLNGHEKNRLPNTLSVCFRGVQANAVIAALPTVAASAGAACHSNEVAVSDTLKAMGVPVEFAMGAIRFSTGQFLTETEMDLASEEVARVVSETGGGD